MSYPAAFLDRDGVINVDSGYVGSWSDFEFLPGAVEGLQRLYAAGFQLVIVTNQSGIARGLYTEEDFFRLMQKLGDYLQAYDVVISAVYHCPFLSNAPIEAYRYDSPLRKPAPGMLIQAIQELDLDASASIMIGDKISDMQAAESAGVTRRFQVTKETAHAGCTVVSGLLEAANLVTVSR